MGKGYVVMTETAYSALSMLAFVGVWTIVNTVSKYMRKGDKS